MPIELKTPPSRLLMVLYNSGVSGGPRISRSLANSLKNRMHVNAILPSAGATMEWFHAAGINIELVPRERLRATWNPLPHLKYLLKFPGTVAAYRRAIRRLRPDIVHVDSLLNVPALLAARLTGTKTLLHVQEIATGGTQRALAFVAGSLADRIVGVSEAAAKPLRGLVDEKKVAVVYNGTRLPDGVPRYNPKGWVSFIGRLSEDKDPISFVRAARMVHEREPSARFMICGLTVPGRRRFEAKLQREIARTFIPKDKFLVIRDRDDIPELLMQSSVVVNCCRVESFGLAVLEAMAAGRPVVVPNCGAFPEFVSGGKTGLLYRPGNIEEMAACIHRLLLKPSLAECIGLAAHALVREQFTEHQMVCAMEEQYKHLLADRND